MISSFKRAKFVIWFIHVLLWLVIGYFNLICLQSLCIILRFILIWSDIDVLCFNHWLNCFCMVALTWAIYRVCFHKAWLPRNHTPAGQLKKPAWIICRQWNKIYRSLGLFLCLGKLIWRLYHFWFWSVHLVNISELFIAGKQRVGNKKADPKPDIVLSGLRWDRNIFLKTTST